MTTPAPTAEMPAPKKSGLARRIAAAVLVGDPRAISIVLGLMLSVAVISLLIMGLFYRAYRDGLEWSLEWIIRNRWSYLAFVGSALTVPLVLVFV